MKIKSCYFLSLINQAFMYLIIVKKYLNEFNFNLKLEELPIIPSASELKLLQGVPELRLTVFTF